MNYHMKQTDQQQTHQTFSQIKEEKNTTRKSTFNVNNNN